MTALNSFNGWMWNDEFLLGEGQFVYSENLDIYRDPRWIQLAVKPTNYKTALPDMVYIIGNASNASNPDLNPRDIWFAFENKDIYDAEWTLRYDGSTLQPLIENSHWRAFWLVPPTRWAMFQDYVGWRFIPYFVDTPAASSVWYRDDGSWPYQGDNWQPYAINTQSYQIGWNWETKPSYQIGSYVFFANSQDQYNIEVTSATGWMDGSGAFWPWYPTIVAYAQGISQPWEVSFASVHSDSVWSASTSAWRVYTELSAISVKWDVANQWVKQLAIERNSKILHWVNKNNTDILVAGAVLEYDYNGQTYISSATYAQIDIYKHYGFWADAQQLIAKSRHHENIETAFDNHWVTYYLVGIYGFTDYNWAKINDMVYCISNKDDTGVIYAYGRTFAGAQDAWSVVVTKNSAGKTMKRIGCLYRNSNKNWFYYTYEDEDGVFGVDYYDDITIDTPTSYQPSGKVFLRTDDGGDMSVNKEVLNLKVGCKVPENTTIIISYILDNSGTEIVYDTISHTTQWSTDYKIYRGNKPVKGFKCISWFVTMTTTGTTTPQLLNFNYDLWIIQN